MNRLLCLRQRYDKFLVWQNVDCNDSKNKLQYATSQCVKGVLALNGYVSNKRKLIGVRKIQSKNLVKTKNVATFASLLEKTRAKREIR